MSAAIAAGHPVTARVGADVLARGGSAVDACVAAGVASWVCEPTVSGPGGGGFMLVYDPRSGRTSCLDFFTALPGRDLAPGAAAPLDELLVEFGTTTQRFWVGPASCAVWGVPAGFAMAHRRFGRLPWADLVAPSIPLAREGVIVTEAQAALGAILDPILRGRPEIAAIFGPHGRLTTVGETLRNPWLAGTLERIAERGASELYSGETAEVICDYLGSHGGAVTREDLESYRVIARRPLRARFAGAELVTNPPPSSGGVLIAHSLGVLEGVELAADPSDPTALALTATALRSAVALRTPAFERALYRGGARRFASSPLVQLRTAEPPVARGTSHISVIDAGGGAASMTCSTGCGSGVVAGDTGVHLNNMLGELDLQVGGVRLMPGDRLTSMMAPSLVVGADGVQLVLGSSGSARIRSVIVQVALHAQRRGLDAAEAVQLPRLHPEGDLLDLEGGFPDGTAEALEALGERVQRWPGRNLYFGGAQVVTSHGGRLSGGGDPRRGGDAVVLA